MSALAGVIAPLPAYLKDAARRTSRVEALRAVYRGGSGLEVARSFTDDPTGFAGTLLNFRPHDWQRGILESSASKMALCCARQVGKSVCSAALSIHVAATKPNSTVVVVAPTSRQSTLFVDRAKFLLDGSPLYKDVEILMREVRFANGSKIIALPGNPATVRGITADLLVLDEAALMAEELYAAVLPTIGATSGRVIMLSTPFGPRGFFHRIFNDPGNDWLKIRITAAESPNISAAMLAQFKRDLPPYRFMSEMECSFDAASAGIFRTEDIAAMLRSDLTPLWSPEGLNILRGDVPDYVFPVAGTRPDLSRPRGILLALDIGNHPDFAAVMVAKSWVDDTAGPVIEAVHVEHATGVDYADLRRRVQSLIRILERHTGRSVWTVVDSTGGGAPIVAEMRRDGFRVHAVNISHTSGKRDGYKQTVGKADLTNRLQAMLQSRTFRVANSAPAALDMVNELASFSAKTSETGWVGYEGRGEHDDLVIAAMLGAWSLFERPRPAVVRRMRGF